MVTRREVVAAGALGALGAGAGDAAGRAGEAGGAQTAEVEMARQLARIQDEMEGLRTLLRQALLGPSLAVGPVADIRRAFGVFLRSNQKFPDYCEIGSDVFTDLYDWHVRQQQPIEVTRVDNRLAIRFMFTWMVMRPEQDAGFIGFPYDRG
ncbi:MAG: hypothetical protein R2712_29635 [Vicinamibacterales bacterium]